FLVWQEGGVTPDCVIEITSESTRQTDSVEKRRLYADLGVTEYFQYDPSGDYLDPSLIGFRLVDGTYEPMTADRKGDGMLTIGSDVLGLELRLDNGQLRFYVPETGQKLLSYSESEVERLQAVKSLAEAEARRERAEAGVYSLAEQLLRTGMSVEQVAAIANLDAADLRQRFGG
ncbi:MAG: Uma2 family endonuclease, partial [Spirulinaceae cyanobacterium SM2_1_0]|nr:Uma2 family endonuclease [Spirulinaceae cyanobacterium SM2_1_0]